MKGQGQDRRSFFEVCRQAASAALRLAVLGLPTVLSIGPAQSQTFSVIHRFTGGGTDGSSPTSGPILDANGNLYGTTNGGGQDSGGIVYEINAGDKFSVLFDLISIGLQMPLAPVVRDSAGNLYGTTDNLLFGDLGEIYKVSKRGVGQELYAFTGGADGDSPAYTNLVFDAKDGYLYGVTAGAFLSDNCSGSSCGTLYKLNTKGTPNITVLHTFGTGNDGWAPGNGLLQDVAGNFYGSTACGGAHGLGTIFELTKAGKYRVLYSFDTKVGICGQNSGGVAGPWGSGALTLDGYGNLYGTTFEDGAHVGNGRRPGMVFKLSALGKLTVLHNFTGGSDGSNPWTGVFLDAKGNLYGASRGGTQGGGTVFEIDKAGKFKVLHTFTGGLDGGDPMGLVMDKSGSLYGTTFNGGDSTCRCGTVFKVAF